VQEKIQCLPSPDSTTLTKHQRQGREQGRVEKWIEKGEALFRQFCATNFAVFALCSIRVFAIIKKQNSIFIFLLFFVIVLLFFLDVFAWG
jgi:hypothetical protein